MKAPSLMLIFWLSMAWMASALDFEFEPGIYDCGIMVREPISDLEYRATGGEWQPIQPLKPSPVEGGRWRGAIDHLEGETRYEVRAKNAKGVLFSGEFTTQAQIPERILTLESTFENCSWELPDAEGQSCRLEYRGVGEQTWHLAPPPVWLPDERHWRGAILLLQEGAEYEVRVTLPGQELRGRFRTQNSNVPIARTVEVSQLPCQLESGMEDGFILYRFPRPLKGKLHLSGLNHLVLDGLTLDGDQNPVALHLENCQNVIVRNCEFYNFCQPLERSWKTEQFGQPVLGNGYLPYGFGGVKITGCEKILVERCFFHHPVTRTNSWFFGHPAGSEAIFLDYAKKGIVIRYNDMVASDLLRWDDAINSAGNGLQNGGLGANGDIYGNFISFTNDDACELEGAGRNLRFYYNRMEQTFAGISTGRCSYGPVYIFRNLLVNGGDQHGHIGPILKNGMGVQGKGSIFFLNNTISASHAGLVPIFHAYHRYPPIIPVPKFKGVSRGNVFVSRSNPFPTNFFEWPGSYDYDVVDYGASTEACHAFTQEHGQEAHAFWGGVRFQNKALGDYRLSQDSNGWRMQAESFLEGVVHAGAFQPDDGLSRLMRPLTFDTAPLSQSTSGEELTFTIVAKEKTHFRIGVNDAFYTVEPMEATLMPGESQRLTVRATALATPLCRIYRGVILIRQDDGFSQPISFAFDRRNNPMAGILFQNGTDLEIKKEEAYFFFARGTARTGEALMEIGNDKIQVNVGPYKRNGTEIIRFIDKRTQKAVRISLKPGRYPFRITGNEKSKLTPQEIIATTTPDLIFNGNLQEE